MMEKIKILHILKAVGGVNIHLRLILESLNTDKFEFVIIHGKNDVETDFKDKNGRKIKTYRLEILRNISPYYDIKASKQIYDIVKNEKPHLIHCHSAKGGILGRLTGFLLKTPTLYTPHAFSFLSTSNKFKRNVFLKIERLFSNFHNKVLACSVSEKYRAIYEVGYDKNNVLLFNNSIKPVTAISKPSVKKTWPDNYICSVGRPSYQKNIGLMIDVIKNLKARKQDIHLVLMGIGFYSPDLNKVKNKIKEYGLESNITMLEWTNRDDILSIIRNSQLYISTARYEGLPYSILESLALSKACVVTNADGNKDLIENNRNGYIVNSDAVTFSTKILDLLENIDRRKNFEKSSFAKFNQKFNINNTIGSLEKIYLKNCTPVKVKQFVKELEAEPLMAKKSI